MFNDEPIRRTLLVAVAAGGVLLFHALSAPGQTIVAHRGASFDAPENTLAAFRLAWEQQADAIEGDFYLSADGQIVCIHDKDTERTAGVKLVVAESTLAQLQKLDVGRWKHERFAGERIPTLPQVLEILPPGKHLFLEVKCGPELIPVLRQVLDQAVNEGKIKYSQVAIIAFNRHVIAAAKREFSRIPCHWLTSYKQKNDTGPWYPTLGEVVGTLREIRADGLDTNANPNVVDDAFARGLRDAGFQFHCWTVNDPANAIRMKNLGVQSITTDRPQFLREHLFGKTSPP